MTVTNDLTHDLAYLVAVWMEAVLYGILIIMFIQSLLVFIHRKRRDSPGPKWMMVAIVLMFVTATLHLSVSLHRQVRAFIFNRESAEHPNGPNGFLDLSRGWSNIAQVILYGVQSLIGDFLNTYRCFVVWDKCWKKCFLPILLLVTTTATGLLVVLQYTNVLTYTTVVEKKISIAITLFYAAAPLQNIITTGFIAYRMWTVDKCLRRSHGKDLDLSPILLVLVESAAIYSIAQLVLFLLYIFGMYAQYLLAETMPPLVGIVFTSIIIRVGLQDDATRPWSASPGSRPSPTPPEKRTSLPKPVTYNPQLEIGMKEIGIKRTEVIQKDVEQGGFAVLFAQPPVRVEADAASTINGVPLDDEDERTDISDPLQGRGAGIRSARRFSLLQETLAHRRENNSHLSTYKSNHTRASSHPSTNLSALIRENDHQEHVFQLRVTAPSQSSFYPSVAGGRDI